MTQKILGNAQKILEQNATLTASEKEALFHLLEVLFQLAEENLPDDASLPFYMQQLSANLLASSHLLATIQELTEELNAIKRLSLSITSSLELQKVLDTIVAEAMTLIKNVGTAHIFLYQDGQLSFGAARFDSNQQRKKPFAMPRPNGLTATVARRGEMIVVPDMAHHPLYAQAPADWHGSIIGLPLKIGKKVVGVMNISRNRTGTFNSREIYLLHMLADQAAIAIENARLHKLVTEQANRDTLTGLPNRRALDQQLEYEMQRSQRSGRPFCVVMLDLDNFKEINDTYGHAFGDEILNQVAQILDNSIRSIDFLSRYGGDEMTLILPETPLRDGAFAITKVRELLIKTDLQLPDGKKTQISFSGGIAEYPTHGDTSSALLRAADAALYHAKKHRRGTIVVAVKGSSTLPSLPDRQH